MIQVHRLTQLPVHEDLVRRWFTQEWGEIDSIFSAQCEYPPPLIALDAQQTPAGL